MRSPSYFIQQKKNKKTRKQEIRNENPDIG